jgi:hypothetical protein
LELNYNELNQTTLLKNGQPKGQRRVPDDGGSNQSILLGSVMGKFEASKVGHLMPQRGNGTIALVQMQLRPNKEFSDMWYSNLHNQN